MTAYYNEFDPSAAAWLRELIKSGEIAPGDVDTRSIEDVRPSDLRGYTQCHFFAGIGGWSLALRMAGWPDDRPVWTGSCPCQPFSAAGKGAGFADERHLWPAFFHLIGKCRPATVFGEQVASRDGLNWLDLVCADLEGAAYAVGAADLCAAGVGAPHIRQRLYWVAHANGGAGRQGRADIRGRTAGSDAQSRAGLGSSCVPGRLADTRSARPLPGSYTGVHSGQESAGSRNEQFERPRATGAADPLHGFWASADWLGCSDGKLRPVEASPQPLVDGLPDGLGWVRDSSVVEIEKEVNSYAASRKTSAPEELRNLCLALGEEAQRIGPLGGLGDIQAPQVLLAFVCQLASQGWSVAQGLPLRRQEGARTGLRMLWDREAAARASRGRGLEEQRVRELADALHFLSPVLARYAQEAWGEAAEAHAEIGFPLGKGHVARAPRLRGYGNAIVPEVAAAFVRAAA